MKAAILESYNAPLVVRDVPTPDPSGAGAVIKVAANGICRSDWHAWAEHWPGFLKLPHVLGHEMCGIVEAVGPHLLQQPVVLPEEISFLAGAGMGCRFMTAFHGLTDRVQLGAGEWIVVYGCGGVGLSVVEIANCLGAQVIAVDIGNDKLSLARELGAVATVNALEADDPVSAVRELTGRDSFRIYGL